MQNPQKLIPATTAGDAVVQALDAIGEGGLSGIAPAFALLAAAGLSPAEPAGQAVLVEAIFQIMEAFEKDPCAPAAHDAVALLDRPVAEAAMTLLFIANFPDGQGSIADLGDATALSLVAFTAAAGQHGEALDFLRKVEAERATPRFLRAAYVLRCRMVGADAGMDALWLAPVAGTESASAARDAIEARPLDLAAHRALVRHLAREGDLPAAFSALVRALALPIGDADKAGMGADLAALAVALQVHGHGALLDAHNVGLAFAAVPGVMAEVRATFASRPHTGAWQAIDAPVIDAAARLFARFEAQPMPAYPLVNGKPHVDTVWLEITNFCNQKCTFCPDMHREEKRSWLPLEDVKRIIDELASSVSVGSMQLNAYGEPLLHPNIKEILAYIREKRLPFSTYFTTHGMTLVEKKLAQLSHNYPQGIAVSLHNDSQESYERTRSAKIGDYETLVARVSALLGQMVEEGAPTHVRLYQMVCNGKEDKRVPPEVRAGFADSAERMMRHVRKWEAIAARIAETAPHERRAHAVTNSFEHIEACFASATQSDGNYMPILRWLDQHGQEQVAFMSPRAVGTYANLLLEYHPTWTVERKLLSHGRCGFTKVPSLAIFASGRLGICCLDLDSTGTFGALSDYGSVREALESVEARRMFAQLSNGIATSKGCQICLAGGKQLCGPAD